MGIQQTKYLLKHMLDIIKVYRQILKGREKGTHLNLKACDHRHTMNQDLYSGRMSSLLACPSHVAPLVLHPGIQQLPAGKTDVSPEKSE